MKSKTQNIHTAYGHTSTNKGHYQYFVVVYTVQNNDPMISKEQVRTYAITNLENMR